VDSLNLEGEGMRSLLSAVEAVEADVGVHVGMPDGFEVDDGDQPRAAHAPAGGAAVAQACTATAGDRAAPRDAGGRQKETPTWDAQGQAGSGVPVRLRRRGSGEGGGGGGCGGDESSGGGEGSDGGEGREDSALGKELGVGGTTLSTRGKELGVGGTTLYALDAPSSSVRHLSSTAIRSALTTLTEHGFKAPHLLLGQKAASALRPDFCFGPDGAELPPEIAELQLEMPETQAAAGGVQISARPLSSDAMPPFGGLLGGWVRGGPKLWAQVYEEAVQRGELAGVKK
jgi:hypothetical protein